MNDSGLLKDLITNYISKASEQNTLLITILVFVIVNIGVAIVGFMSQYHLKKQDIEVYKRNLRESRRMDMLHEVYKRLDLMRNIFNDDPLLLNKLKDINSYVNENNIYLRKDELKIITQSCDYFSTILVSQSNKDVKTEKKFLDNLKNEFNK